MKLPLLSTISVAICAFSVPAQGANRFLVKDGRPTAEIVIAEDPPRTTRLAADELQTYIEKISGAKLPIVTTLSPSVDVKVYVGQSSHTEQLKITADQLKYGAYRITSGNSWLALIGDDTDFTPIEPWPRSNNDLVSGKMQTAWDEITGDTWGYPLSQLRKHYTGSTGLFGTSKEQRVNDDGAVNVWGFDERGSLNAVCGFLRSLGVRWYMPGDLGEIVPHIDTIALPDIDQTVHPDFEVRRFNVRFGIVNRDTAMWAMRLGMRDPYGLRVAHGMHRMTQRDEILKAHPDWFALYGGKRDNEPGKRLNHLCYSSKELFQETVRWARAQLDHFKFDTVSVMPPDAYIAICQCPLCEGKDSPERGSRGKLSDHVWDFVNRVAKEVGKTHPNKEIVCCAYGANTDPPQNINKLQPNVQVIIVGGRRPRNSLPEQREAIRDLRAGWAAKTDNPLMVFENYPITDRGWYLPAFVPRTIGHSVNATKGVSKGEDIWLSFGRNFDTKNVGFNHFQVYFTARMYWGGPEQDVMAMLEEYCRLFYGPAGASMHDFFIYCEDHWQEMENDKSKVDTALELFASAKSAVSSESIYAKRLALIDEFLDALRSKSEQLGRKRGPVPKLRMVWDAEQIEVDGKLDDEYWQRCPTAATGRFRELQTGRQPVFGTSVKCGWSRSGDLYFAIRCDEHPGDQLNIATTKQGDQAIWYGDVVEILLETDSHSYYQIAVNPAGALVDLDRGANKSAWDRWESQAEVATQVADDHWTVEIRIPVTDDANDPLNHVVGRKPSGSLPWHINLGRQRIRAKAAEYSAFSPTGAKSFHEVMKFAHFYDGRSQKFDQADPENDYLHDRKQADGLLRSGQREQAMTAFASLAERAGLTELQKSDALQLAAAAACALKNYDRAAKFADQIPIAAVSKTVQMQNLLAQRKSSELTEKFGSEDLSTWPFWNIGEAYFARGRAYVVTGIGDKAETDLHAALEFTSDSRTRLSILRTIGNNRENNLKDDDTALQTYQQIAGATKNNGSAEYFYGVLGANRILTRRGQFERALQTLDLVDAQQLSGTWRGSILLARGDTLAAAGRQTEAISIYQGILGDAAVIDQHRKKAEEAIKKHVARRSPP